MKFTGNSTAHGERALLEVSGRRKQSTASTRPAPQARGHGLSIYWPLLITTALLYGSLIPFQLDGSAYQRSNAWGLYAIAWHDFDLNDFITNIVVYIPLGFSMMGLYLYQKRFTLFQMIGVIVVGTTISMIVESLQTGIPQRVASWWDIGFNALGTGIGTTVFLLFRRYRRSLLITFQDRWLKQPFQTAAMILTLSLFVYELVPFDFITSTAALHNAFHQAQWFPLLTGSTVTGQSFTASFTEQLAGAAWFSLLGFLLAGSKRSSTRHPSSALGFAIQHGVILVGVIECMQLFTRSHVFELEAIAVRTLAVACGAWCAVFPVGTGFSRRKQHKRSQNGTVYFFAILAALQIIAVIAANVDPHLRSITTITHSSFHRLPFESLWHEPFLRASALMLSTIFTYGTLAITLLVLLDRAGTRYALSIVYAAVPLVALLLETAQFLTGSGTPDITTTLLACFSAFVSTRTYSAIFQTPNAYPAAAR